MPHLYLIRYRFWGLLGFFSRKLPEERACERVRERKERYLCHNINQCRGFFYASERENCVQYGLHLSITPNQYAATKMIIGVRASH
jgi:hypothetical protein